jgi:putative membrane protein
MYSHRQNATRPNADSMARGQLANEHTTLGVAAYGRQRGRPRGRGGDIRSTSWCPVIAFGLILFFAGLLMSTYGTWRYRAVGRQLGAGAICAGFGAVITVSAVTLS